MLGILIGTACLIGLVKVLRHERRGFGYGYGRWDRGHGRWCRGGRFGGEAFYEGGEEAEGGPGYRGGSYFTGPFGRGFGWGGPGFFLRRLVDHLEATPEQEKVILAAFGELRDEGVKVRDEAHKTRGEIAKLMRGPSFDEVMLGELFARHDSALESMRRALTGALAKVHDSLDERQRARLADLIEHGPGWSGWFRRARSRGYAG